LNQTQNETWEQKQARLAKEKAMKRKREQEIDEALLMGYMAGNVGNGYAMYAAAEMVNG
jgi:hypothetical protein